ncbi:hypothetical protein DVG78_11145 [Runella aurantiaca]|jgi:hypothetical protein|uniref:Uncharacterized protein n=1 Tax=Runella aurantiaca TaxID=2282308 RepID=A0A369ICG6_9BACT|nr:hypothetical protein DVG78_11145 [Runella aurantiaca]
MKLIEKIVRVLLGIILGLCLLVISPLFIPYFLIKGYHFAKKTYLTYKLSQQQKKENLETRKL